MFADLQRAKILAPWLREAGCKDVRRWQNARPFPGVLQRSRLSPNRPTDSAASFGFEEYPQFPARDAPVIPHVGLVNSTKAA